MDRNQHQLDFDQIKLGPKIENVRLYHWDTVVLTHIWTDKDSRFLSLENRLFVYRDGTRRVTVVSPCVGDRLAVHH